MYGIMHDHRSLKLPQHMTRCGRQVMGALLTVAILVGWVYVMGMTLIKAWQGHLFRAYSPSQPMADLRGPRPAEPAVTNGVNGL